MGSIMRGVMAGLALGCAATALSVPARADDDHHYNWSGLYFGGHVGGSWADQSWSLQNGGLREDFDHKPGAAVYGAQVGLQHQWSKLVTGIEVSFTGNSDLHEKTDAGNAALIGVGRVRQTDINSVSTVAGRLGWSMGTWMPYIRAGYSWGQVSFTSADQNTFASGIARLNGSSKWEGGYNIGGGLEWAWQPNVIFGVQYDFTRLGGTDRLNHQFTNGGAAPIFNVGDADIHTVTARLSFKLNRPEVRHEDLK